MDFKKNTENLIHEIANEFNAHDFNTYKLYLLWDRIGDAASAAEEIGDVENRASAAYESLNFYLEEEEWDLSIEEYAILYRMIEEEEGEE